MSKRIVVGLRQQIVENYKKRKKRLEKVEDALVYMFRVGDYHPENTRKEIHQILHKLKPSKYAFTELDKTISGIKPAQRYYGQDIINFLDSENASFHKCSFGFEKKHIGKKGHQEPKKGERGFSYKRDDWVCSCGKTRREYLSEKESLNSKRRTNETRATQ